MRHAEFAFTSGPAETAHDASLLSRVGNVVGRWTDRYSQRRALSQMDDHMLKDIGVNRFDAAIEVEKPFWQP